MHEAVVMHWQSHLLLALRSALEGESQCALVDVPNHGNIGDYLIQNGTLTALERLGVHVTYVCDWRTYDSRRLQALCPCGPILFQGGGNFGDLWPHHQDVRHRVITDFPHRHVVQLPQSLHWQDPVRMACDMRRMSSANRLTMFVRDRSGLELCARHGLRASLVPDMAFALPEMPCAQIFQSAGQTTTWLLRRDRERLTTRTSSAECWIDPPVLWPDRLKLKAGNWFSALGNHRFWMHCQQNLCRLALHHALRHAAGWQSVVTDRLHVHILCALRNIPHVLLDTLQGKTHAYYETWTQKLPCVRFAHSIEEAEQLLS